MLSGCIVLTLLAFAIAIAENNVSTCYNFQANFDIKTIAGLWHVVAIVPGIKSSELIHCKSAVVNFTDIDQSRLKDTSTSKSFDAKKIQGIVLRQDYDYGDTFYATAVSGVSGCFHKIFTEELNDKAPSKEEVMQLHILSTDEKSDPFLVQLLFGNEVSAAVFRKNMSATIDELKPVLDFLTKQRGPRQTPVICD